MAPVSRTIEVSIDADGHLFCDGQPVDTAQWSTRFAQAAYEPVPAQLELRADHATRYESIAGVMSAAQRAGLTRIAFVTLPVGGGAH
nr:biopolymer transporter ExbD [Mycetohabitans sp. B8]